MAINDVPTAAGIIICDGEDVLRGDNEPKPYPVTVHISGNGQR
jgi:hypothetical protein